MADTPGLVAWEDLKMGETYWVVMLCDRMPTKATPDCIWGEGESYARKEPGFSYGKWRYWPTEMDKTPDGKPMIFSTCAEACDAMIERLQAFKEEQEVGNE